MPTELYIEVSTSGRKGSLTPSTMERKNVACSSTATPGGGRRPDKPLQVIDLIIIIRREVKSKMYLGEV